MELISHEFHENLGAHFAELNGAEIVGHYSEVAAEHSALRHTAGILDLSFRSRLCLTGADRVRFLHGQVTNDINRLRVGEGCYAALVTAKGKLESDLDVFYLQDELLLDFEPGFSAAITQRLEKFIVADDVQVVDVATQYGLLSVQGPKAAGVVHALGLSVEVPPESFHFTKMADATLGEVYLMNQPRLNTTGFDLFVPVAALGAVLDKMIAAAKSVGGCACGWNAFEIARIEAGIPRFGADMDETNIPIECGIEARAISYRKGCYIGQEVLNRIHTLGHVNKELCGLCLANDLKQLPSKGDKLFHAGKEAGYLTSAVRSLALNANIALAYARREVNQTGTQLSLRTDEAESAAKITKLPFVS